MTRPDPWIKANPELARNASLVRDDVFTAAFEALCAAHGVVLTEMDETTRERFESSPEGEALADALDAALRAAFIAYAEDRLTRSGTVDVQGFAAYLAHS